MNFDDFKYVCFTQGINQDAIESCRDFVLKEMRFWLDPNSRFSQAGRYPENDLGFAELADTVDPVESIKYLAECQMWATCDYDSLGRSLAKIRLKQFSKDPGKHFRRHVLKSFYLNNGTN
jgi:hypothetical protein